MDPLLERIEDYIRRHDLLVDGEKVVVGISGGVDSIVVAAMLLELRYPLSAVHVNHQLRGGESDGDEAFVRRWCGARGIQLHVRSIDVRALARVCSQSVQQAARAVRYEMLEDVADEIGSRKVAVGHHRDDQAETVLLNLFRGTGPEGLAGMPARRKIRPDSRVEVVRPLLAARRHEVEVYALALGEAWREDASNANPKYRRGALRGEIVPLLERHFGEAVIENIVRSSELVRAYREGSLDSLLQAAFSAALYEIGGRGVVELDVLKELAPVLRRRVYLEALRRWLPGVVADARAATELDELAGSQVGRRLEYGVGSVWRERGRLLFVSGSEAEPGRRGGQLRGAGDVVPLPGGSLAAEVLPAPPRDPSLGAPNVAYLDARAVRFPLVVRTWRPGDRFVPLGMDGSKKLSDFLTDERVSSHRKQDVAVVESQGRIVWVVALRVAHGARLQEDSMETVRLRFLPDSGPGRGENTGETCT
jgi:tRNA(Ile)-lysidine synthase